MPAIGRGATFAEEQLVWRFQMLKEICEDDLRCLVKELFLSEERFFGIELKLARDRRMHYERVDRTSPWFLFLPPLSGVCSPMSEDDVKMAIFPSFMLDIVIKRESDLYDSLEARRAEMHLKTVQLINARYLIDQQKLTQFALDHGLDCSQLGSPLAHPLQQMKVEEGDLE